MHQIATPVMHHMITELLVLLLASEVPLEYHIADKLQSPQLAALHMPRCRLSWTVELSMKTEHMHVIAQSNVHFQGCDQYKLLSGCSYCNATGPDHIIAAL